MTTLETKGSLQYSAKAHQFPPTRSRPLPLTSRLQKKLRLKLLLSEPAAEEGK